MVWIATGFCPNRLDEIKIKNESKKPNLLIRNESF
jgi:hypothetical protein